MALEGKNDVNESPEKVNDIGTTQNPESEEIFKGLFQDDFGDSENPDTIEATPDKLEANLENDEENTTESRPSEDIMRDIFEDDYQEEESIEEKIKKQDEIIEKVESGDIKLETTQEKGNYGEMKMDQCMRKLGYERIMGDMITSLDADIHHGLDGVYYNPNGHPPLIIADAKYGSAQLSMTSDGLQMSKKWINERLGEEFSKEDADKISKALDSNSPNVERCVVHVYENGDTEIENLDLKNDKNVA